MQKADFKRTLQNRLMNLVIEFVLLLQVAGVFLHFKRVVRWKYAWKLVVVFYI